MSRSNTNVHGRYSFWQAEEDSQPRIVINPAAGTISYSADGSTAPATVLTFAASGAMAITGVLSIANGTEETPSVAFADDLDSGLYRSGANGVGISATDFVVGEPAGGKTNMHVATVVLSALTGATKAADDLIPAGVFVLGVTTKVDTLITGASSYNIGDGSDADRWGASISKTKDTESDFTDLVGLGPQIEASSLSVVLTAQTSNFTAGAVSITAHWIDLSAGT